ncbi:hypothetical protein PSQ90_12445 [Devosia rhodophyticola]|uniref:MarR family transcriptional regulator n=1 Tax=Devosia rhodophyticola TaxID=3026423 RepID=A0ABY7YVL9_9HYPH|nr:hypothetical protein [Devosia rhodophyticola]WDR05095.1 hypothetical protein PSQ90_12445 [Devosia rhodophyticola]
MSRPSSRSNLYRLIEAGQLAHQAVLVPLRERGLEPGDDAVLFILARQGTAETELAQELGTEPTLLEPRIARLIERDLVTRQAVGPLLTPGLALTERGTRIRDSLAENWAELEKALMGELKKKQRKSLGETLKRFNELLRL